MLYLVEILLYKNVIGSIEITAKDRDAAEAKALEIIKVKTKPAYKNKA